MLLIFIIIKCYYFCDMLSLNRKCVPDYFFSWFNVRSKYPSENSKNSFDEQIEKSREKQKADNKKGNFSIDESGLPACTEQSSLPRSPTRQIPGLPFQESIREREKSPTSGRLARGSRLESPS